MVKIKVSEIKKNKMVEEKYFRSNGTRVELDLTEDDKGIFLWNSEGWHDVEEIEDLIKTLQKGLKKLS